MKIFGFILASLYFFFCIYSSEWHFINTVDLIFHEAGHTLVPTFIFGEIATALGGSIFQIFIPLICAVYFLRRKDIFSFAILMMWVAENIANVSRYASDALKMELPLLGGDNVIHDWNFILGNFNLLMKAELIASILYALSWVIFVYVFFLGISTLLQKRV
ncbi:MAG: hypothetical protein V4686_02895 [Patescibacteria group bacterium]